MTKKHNDKTGWLRGAKGIDGAYDKDGKEFMRSYDPEADRAFYGKPAVGADPRTSTNKDKR